MRYLAFILGIYFSTVVNAEVRLPKLISNGMILQRNTELTIWGWADYNEKVTVTFRDSTYFSTTDSLGKWHILLPSQTAGGPYIMTIKGFNQLTINNILIGDVWLCAGQSNMELPIRRVYPKYKNELNDLNYNEIRQFAVPQTYDFNSANDDLKGGSWKSTTQENLMDFSAVAFFFAQQIYQTQKVPIGIINASLGGSPIEAWMSEEALKPFPKAYSELQRFKDSSVIREVEASDNHRNNKWYNELQNSDKFHFEWRLPNFDDSIWPTMTLPGYWASTSLGEVNGAVWFRKTIDIPKSMANQPAQLNMGRIVDADSVFINGKHVGSTSYQYPPRWYTVSANILKEGKNSIAIKVISNSGKGGFVPDKPYELTANGITIDLKGEWRYQLSTKMEPLAASTFVRWQPAGLFNAMLAPLTHYQIKGALWYQGESNTTNAAQYAQLLPDMIADWRSHWHQGDFPFIFAQLPNFMEVCGSPMDGDWPRLRESQLQTLSVINTAMTVNIDLGEWNDIHPLNKKDVGLRLARAAESLAYTSTTTAMGPIYKDIEVKGDKIEINFTNADKGLLTSDGKPLAQFAIAGADREFVWAVAKIKGDKVIVKCPKVAKPVAVRYAWANNPQGANLINTSGLLASPFRTDNW